MRRQPSTRCRSVLSIASVRYGRAHARSIRSIANVARPELNRDCHSERVGRRQGYRDRGEARSRQTLACLHGQNLHGAMARSEAARLEHPRQSGHRGWQRRRRRRSHEPSRSPTEAVDLANEAAYARSIHGEPEEWPHSIAASFNDRTIWHICLRQMTTSARTWRVVLTHYLGSCVSRCSCSMRRTSLIASGFPWAEWPERTIFSDRMPSTCALS